MDNKKTKKAFSEKNSPDRLTNKDFNMIIWCLSALCLYNFSFQLLCKGLQNEEYLIASWKKYYY